MQQKTILFAAGIITAAGIIIASANLSGNNDKKEAAPLTQEQKVQRGSYLVNAMGCDDCHSPKKMGPHGPEVIEELRFSGYPSERPIIKPDSNSIKQGWSLFGTDFTSAAGVWGMSFAANITSDATGIGNWKEEQFIKAIREGKWKGLDNSRPLLPPMPWFEYKNLTDEDLQSIFAYLKTTKPVKNIVPAPRTPAELK
jgi:mono/diheme cytochrome c family protein